MKVKVPGRRPEEFFPFNKDGICGTCGCTVRLEPGDTFSRSDCAASVACPNESCKGTIVIYDPSNTSSSYYDR